MQGGLKKRRNMLLRKQEGAVEAVILCSVLLLCLVGITVYSLQLRVAKNEKDRWITLPLRRRLPRW